MEIMNKKSKKQFGTHVLTLLGLIAVACVLGLSLPNASGMSVQVFKYPGGLEKVTIDFYKEDICKKSYEHFLEKLLDEGGEIGEPEEHGTFLSEVVEKISKTMENYKNSTDVEFSLNFGSQFFEDEDLTYLLSKIDITKFSNIDFSGNRISLKGFEWLIEFAKNHSTNFPRINLSHDTKMVLESKEMDDLNEKLDNLEIITEKTTFSNLTADPLLTYSKAKKLIVNADLQWKIIISKPRY